MLKKCALFNNILKIKLNYETTTKNISKRPVIVLFPYSPQSCINILKFHLLQHGLTNYNYIYIYPISKHCFQKLIKIYICTIRNVTFYENDGNIHINIFKTCTAFKNHVKTMHTGHLQQYLKYFLLYYSQYRFKNY